VRIKDTLAKENERELSTALIYIYTDKIIVSLYCVSYLAIVMANFHHIILH